MYDRITTSMETPRGKVKKIPIRIGFNQGSSTLSSNLFNIVFNVLSEKYKRLFVNACFLWMI